MGKKLNVLMLPEIVGGEPGGIADGLRSLGDDVTVVTKWPHPFGYDYDRIIYPDYGLGRIEIFLRTFRAGLYLFEKWDVVHFTFGSTLFDPGNYQTKIRGVRSFIRRILEELRHGLQVLELVILKLRGIPAFFHFQGDDARQGSALLSRYDFSIAHAVTDGYYTLESDAAKIRKIKRFAKWASGIFAVNPDLMWVLPSGAKFVPYAAVNSVDYEPSWPSANDGPLVFAHAPSHRGVKGTDRIVEAMRFLQDRGKAVDLDLIEGVSNKEAIDRIRKCDVLIDQIYAGWYGGVAVEAMSLGKPVICFIREEDLVWVDSDMRSTIPIIQTTPDSLIQTLESISSMSRIELDEIGKSSREFVDRWHGGLRVVPKIRSSYLAAKDF